MKKIAFLISCLFAFNVPATLAASDGSGGGEGSGRFQKMIEDHRDRHADRAERGAGTSAEDNPD
jgi:hypothetical protein